MLLELDKKINSSCSMDDWNPMLEDYQNRDNDKYLKTQLFVCNLPPALSEKGLRNLFSSYGKITRVCIPSTRSGDQRFGFVGFSSHNEAETALNKMDKAKIGKFELHVRFAKVRNKNTTKKEEKKVHLKISLETKLAAVKLKINEHMISYNEISKNYNISRSNLKLKTGTSSSLIVNENTSVSFCNQKSNTVSNSYEVFDENPTKSKIDQVDKCQFLKTMNIQEIPECFEAKISHFISYEIFYLHILNDNYERFLTYNKNLQLFCSNNNIVKLKYFSLGAACLVKNPSDKVWYRAVIKKINKLKVKLVLVDSGAQIEEKTTEIYKLPIEYFEFCPQAVSCQLDSAITNNADKNLRTCFDNIHNKKLLIQVKQKLKDKVIVEILKVQKFVENKYNDQKSCLFKDECLTKAIKEKIVCLNSPKSLKSVKNKTNTGILSAVSLSESQSNLVMISHVNSPSDFYIQVVEKNMGLLDQQDKMMKYFNVKRSLLQSVELGCLCVIKYKVDNAWYRAKVLEIIDSRIIIQFIDYGNTESVMRQDLLDLPEFFRKQPMHAIKASLADCYPMSNNIWCKKSIDFVKQYVSIHKRVKIINKSLSCLSIDVFVDGNTTLKKLLLNFGLATTKKVSERL